MLAYVSFVSKVQRNTYTGIHAWWYSPVISALGRLRQENSKFQVSLGYMERPCLKSNKNNKKLDSVAQSYNPSYSGG
jgi:hypothetical protein